MAAQLKSDAAGFLVGEIMKMQDDILTAQNDSVAVLSRIRSDVSAIARAINVQTKAQARATASVGGQRAPRVAAVPVGRSSNVHTAGGNQVGRAAASATARRANMSVAVPTARDAQGRFVKGESRGGRGTAGAGAGSAVGGGLSRISEGIGKLTATLSATDNVDPTLNAMKEVTDVVAPLGRGLFSMFGRSAERKKERWYTRILTAIKGNKPGAPMNGGGGRGGLFGIGGGAGGGLLGGALGLGKGAIKGLGGLLGKGGKLLKRIPVLGGLLAGGLALGSMFGMDDDPSKTPEENRARRYKGAGGGVGMGVGGVIGGVLGSVLGPVGTVVGGYLGSMAGEMIGEKAGEWAKSMIDSDIGGKIVSAWETTTTFIGGMWDSLVTDAKNAWGSITTTASEWWDITKDAAGKLTDKIGELAGAANSWIKDKTGVDVKQSASTAWDATKGAASNTWEKVKFGAGQVADFAADNAGKLVPNTVKRAVTAGGAAVTQAKAGYDEKRGNPTDAPAPKPGLQTAARAAGGAVGSAVNMGSNAAMMLQAGRDAGMGNKELANFMGQNAHESGGFRTLNENLNYSAAGLQKTFGKYYSNPADAARDAKNPESIANRVYGGRMGNTDTGDGYKFRGRGFTQLTGKDNYAAAGKALGLDLVNNPDLAADPANAAKISAWYWKNRVSSKGAGEDVAKATKLVNGGFIGLEDRQKKVADWQAKLNAGGAAMPMTPAVATAGLTTPASAGVPPAVPAQLPEPAKNEVPEKLNSGAASGGKVQVSLKDKTTQNIGDRGIAHIASGGIGSGY